MKYYGTRQRPGKRVAGSVESRPVLNTGAAAGEEQICSSCSPGPPGPLQRSAGAGGGNETETFGYKAMSSQKNLGTR